MNMNHFNQDLKYAYYHLLRHIHNSTAPSETETHN